MERKTVFEIGRELDLALVVVELGETSTEAAERAERDFWSGNTDKGALERAWKKGGAPS